MVTFLGMATIIGRMTNDHSRDGGHPRGRLEDFDHFGEGHLPSDGDHPRESGCLWDFDHPKRWLLNFGPVDQIKQSVSLSVNLWVIELHTQLKRTC